MPNERLILGAMSGTSADGVDVALTHITGRGLQMQAKLLAHAYHPYSPELRKQILEMRQRGDVRLNDLAEMGRQVTLGYVEACKLALKQGNVSADQVAAIAAHGQTLFHSPPNTIQYFDPSLLAYEMGIAVVSDFRRADLAAGGQGAPLVPFADWILFRHPTRPRAIVNIGGIANITCLFAGAPVEKTLAFDVGPGNCISDHLMRTRSSRGEPFDQNGKLALQGNVDGELWDAMRAHPYFINLGPKSTDGPEMIEMFAKARAQIARPVALQDELATVAYLVATQIARALYVFGGQFTGDLFIAGGGVQNEAIMKSFEGLAKPVPLTMSAIGGDIRIDLAAAREALAFALLGAATLDGEPSNVPSATGASRKVVLGSITPKP